MTQRQGRQIMVGQYLQRLALLGILSAFAAMLPMAGTALAQTLSTSADPQGEGPKLPRFASLKINPTNLRKGPGTNYPVAWVLRRAGMPLEILREYENWREVRDADGTTGWVHRAFVSGRRTASVLPWSVKENGSREIAELRESESSTSALVARLEAGAVVDISSCDGRWCEVWVQSFTGFIEQDKLWGVYPDEIIQ